MITDREAIEALQLKLTKGLRVAMPATIRKYDYTKQMADVEFSPELLADDNILELPPISGIPVIFPMAGGASITMPVKVGDGCLVVFLDRDSRQWVSGNFKEKPLTMRSHNLNDAVAIIGLSPFSKKSPAKNNNDFSIQYDGASITIKPGGIIDIHCTDLNLNGNLKATGTIKGSAVETNAGISLKGHTHIYQTPTSTAGPGNTSSAN